MVLVEKTVVKILISKCYYVVKVLHPPAEVSCEVKCLSQGHNKQTHGQLHPTTCQPSKYTGAPLRALLKDTTNELAGFFLHSLFRASVKQ